MVTPASDDFSIDCIFLNQIYCLAAVSERNTIVAALASAVLCDRRDMARASACFTDLDPLISH
jgi:hypothetical protein